MNSSFKRFSLQTIVSLGFILFCGFLISSPQKTHADCNADPNETCAQEITFSDTKSHRYKEAISYAQRNEIVKGYSDGTFRPNAPVNRAEFTKILVESLLGKTPTDPIDPCFPDINQGMWFEKYVCYGKGKLFDGYPDGSFKPSKQINVAEAAKIMSNAFEIPLPSQIPGEQWFGVSLAALESKGALPETLESSSAAVTRAEMVEMIRILNEKLSNTASLKACDFVPERCSDSSALNGYGDAFLPDNIDMSQVRSSWLSWNNEVRKQEGLHEYLYNNQLNRSAYVWSDFSKQRGQISHKRIGQTEYYDYNMITAWFANLGLKFQNVYRVTHTENIGAGPYRCDNTDCTQELINSIRSTFDHYMGEKNKEYRPHYNSVMNGYFNEIGLGISIDKENKKYYLTVHYGTKLI